MQKVLLWKNRERLHRQTDRKRERERGREREREKERERERGFKLVLESP